MADRCLVHGFGSSLEAESAAFRDRLSTIRSDALKAISQSPVVVADSVVKMFKDVGISTWELPSVAPPWPQAWIEFHQPGAALRWGCLVEEMASGPDADDLVKRLAADVQDQAGRPDGVRWLLQISVFAERSSGGQPLGPLGWVGLALSEAGRIIGESLVAIEDWRINGEPVAPDDDDDRRCIWSVAAMACQTIALLHCRNVSTDLVRPPEKLSIKHRRRHGRPLLRYQTIRLEIPRKSRSGRVSAGSSPSRAALHMVAGHFAHYGDCCPGVHESKGLLFGKLSGVYWQPLHVQGSPEHGVVLSDFELLAPSHG